MSRGSTVGTLRPPRRISGERGAKTREEEDKDPKSYQSTDSRTIRYVVDASS